MPLPAIPDINAKSVDNLQSALDSIKELLEVLIKRRGTNTDDQAVLYGDAIIDSLNALIDGASSFSLLDTGNDHTLTLQVNENFSANRTLNLILGDADRTITLSGSPTLGDWFDQAVKQASSPTFAGIVITGAGTVDGRDVSADGATLDGMFNIAAILGTL